MTREHINIRETFESICKRQHELTKGNAKIVDWAMKTVSRNKKVSFPQINIYDYVPYIIMPPDVPNVNIPFSQQLEPEPIPFVPSRQFTDIPIQTQRIRMKPRTKLPGEPFKPLKEPKETKKKRVS